MPQTIRHVIDTILAAIPGEVWPGTVDTFRSGDPNQPVTGIVTTFVATQAVIERAITLGANLIISHEGVLFTHNEPPGWLMNDPVRQAKQRLLDENGIVVWRFHDGWHRIVPDGIVVGLVKKLGWEAYAEPSDVLLSQVCNLPIATTVGDLAAEVKAKVGASVVRVIGDLAMPCQRVGVQVGFSGNMLHMRLINEGAIDVLVCGEAHEWEATEYVRDAVAQGHQIAMILLGHAQSEEPGMEYLVEWLGERVSGVPITHVPADALFTYV